MLSKFEMKIVFRLISHCRQKRRYGRHGTWYWGIRMSDERLNVENRQ